MLHNYVKSVLLCEDLRSELSGKEFAIGILAGNLIVPHIPFLLDHLVIRIELFTSGEVVPGFLVKMDDPLGSELFRQQVMVSFRNWDRPGAVALGVNGLFVRLSGIYKIYAKYDIDPEWTLIRELFVDKIDLEAMRKDQLEHLKVWEKNLK